MRMILRFTELNQYGLPRAVGEVEMSLGTFKLHVFPHQVGKINLVFNAPFRLGHQVVIYKVVPT